MGALAASALVVGHAIAQAFNPPDQVEVTSVSSTAVTLRLPALPQGATSFTLQRATSQTTPSLPPASGRIIWFKADGAQGDANAPVSRWANVGTSGDATQAQDASRPLFVPTAINGRPALRFDGVDDFLALPAGISDFTQGLSAFVVAKPTSNAFWSRLFDFGNGPASDNILLARQDGSANLRYEVYNGGSTAGLSAGGVLVNNRPQILGVVQQAGAVGNQSSATLFANGAQVSTGQAFIPRVLSRSNNYLAKSNWPDALFQGDIAEIVLYNKALSTAEMEDVQRYLAFKYALPLASGTTETSNWTSIATRLASQATFEDTPLTPDTVYTYRCVAVGDDGSVPGNGISVKTIALAPGAPTAPTFSDVAATHLQVDGAPLPAHAINLVLQRKLASEGDEAYTVVAQNVTGNYLVEGLSPSTTYRFRFVAVGEGGQTPGPGATVETAIAPPAPPLAPTVQSVGGQSFSIKMPALPSGATSLSLQRAVASAQTPLAPPSSGLTTWFKADSIAAADQEEISSWNDSSGNNNNATAPAAYAQPKWIANGLNGNPVVRMDGVNDYLKFPAQTNVRTAIVVARHLTGSQDWTPILGSSNFSFHGGASNDLFSGYTSEPVRYGLGFQDGQALDVMAMKKPTSFRVLTFVPTAPVRVDCLSNQEGWDGRAWNGDYAEVLLYDRILTEEERAQAEGYLQAKYALGNGVTNLNWSTLATGLGAGQVYNDTSPVPTTRYYYRCVGFGVGGTTPGAVTTAILEAPVAPPAPSLSAITSQSVKVTVGEHLSRGATSYSLQRSQGAAIPYPAVAGLALHLDADSLAEGSVGAWNDQSAQGNTAQQSEPSARPTLITNGLSGHSVVRFDGVDDYLSLPTGMSDFTQGISAFVVAKSAPTNWARYFDFGNGPGSDNIFLGRYGASSTLRYESFFGGGSVVTHGDGVIADNSPQLLGLVQPPGNSGDVVGATLFVNGNAVNSGPGYVPAVISRTKNYIGKSNWGNDGLLQGDMAEVMIYNRALSPTERQSVETYLNSKYGLGQTSIPGNLNWTTIATGLSAKSVFVDSPLTPKTLYYYRYVAVNAAGTTTGSATRATTLPAPPPPATPGSPTFSDLTVQSVVVTASALPERAQSLSLQQKIATEDETAYHTIASNLQANSSTLVDNLSPATTYSFRFLAVGLGGTTPGVGANIQIPTSAISGFQWSTDGEQWNDVGEDTVLRVERFSHVGLRALKTTPNSPWPGGLSGPLWSWQGTKQEGEEVWLTGEQVTNGTPDEAKAFLNNSLSVHINVLPKAYLYMSLPSQQVSAPPGNAMTDAVPVTIVAKDTDGLTLPFFKVRVTALNAKDQVVGVWGNAATGTPSLILTADAQGQIQTSWFGPDNAGRVQLKAVAVDGDNAPFGDGDSANITVVP